MDPILEQTDALARALADDPRTRALKAARDRLGASPADADLQQRYHHAARQLGELEQAGRPIEPPLKRELLALTEQVRRSAVLQALLKTHAEFDAMMEEVSRRLSSAVEQALGAPPPPPPPA